MPPSVDARSLHLSSPLPPSAAASCLSSTLPSHALTSGGRDIWYRKAKELGYRARSAFKLLQVAETCQLFDPSKPIQRAVDLCAAPGSWSQVLVRRLYPSARSIPRDSKQAPIVAVDLQEMAPIDGVRLLQGDITSRSTAQEIIDHFSGEKVELVVCDGAPDVTGMHEIDEYLQGQLLLSALNITTHLLKEGSGVFVAKIFRAEAYQLLCSQLQIFFKSVQCIKPASSRAKSAEHFIVCKQFSRPPGYEAVFVDAVSAPYTTSNTAAQSNDGNNPTPPNPSPTNTHSSINQLIMPFLKCGDFSPHDSLQPPNLTQESPSDVPSSNGCYLQFSDGMEQDESNTSHAENVTIPAS